MATPDAIVIANGSQEQYDELIQQQIDDGYCVPLNPEKKPGSVAYNSDPSDVARVENRTYIASETKDEAGPTNNWIDPVELKKTMTDSIEEAQGRTLYVIPFSMGPLPPIAKIGVETDSAYVVLNMMTDPGGVRA